MNDQGIKPTEDQIRRAIAAIPRQGSKEIKTLMANAEKRGAIEVVLACQRELTMRGPGEISAEQAKVALQMAEETDGTDLRRTVEVAFQRVKPSSDEVRLIRLVASNPNTFSANLEEQYGGGFNLDIGHLVYFRYGFFRKFMTENEMISDILISKDRTSGRTFYFGFRPEVLSAFKDLKLI